MQFSLQSRKNAQVNNVQYTLAISKLAYAASILNISDKDYIWRSNIENLT